MARGWRSKVGPTKCLSHSHYAFDTYPASVSNKFEKKRRTTNLSILKIVLFFYFSVGLPTHIVLVRCRAASKDLRERKGEKGGNQLRSELPVSLSPARAAAHTQARWSIFALEIPLYVAIPLKVHVLPPVGSVGDTVGDGDCVFKGHVPVNGVSCKDWNFAEKNI
ncbi:hypothetical protein CEXT_120711 [Caerostris extrusa]|uniref:Uncharacterized protein n=1 Tax=Caerostris extrusa TaxID=172846 RepID=A0AAV4WZ47_CAEEX|nr:hypothetical protein CEXT_120711 [Caerostris extrusa]